MQRSEILALTPPKQTHTPQKTDAVTSSELNT